MEGVTKAGIALACAAVMLVGGFAGGWVVNGWRMSAAVAEARQARAVDRAESAESTLSDLVEGASRVKAAAEADNTERVAITGKLEQLSKDLQRYAKDKPLPADCRPDAGRVRSLAEAVAAAKQATAR